MSHDNHVSEVTLGPPSTLLPADHADLAVIAELGEVAGLVDTSDVDAVRAAAARHPDSSLAWALLARTELDGVAADPEATPADAVTGYAYARIGYHRGLDALRRAGWRGAGLVPVAHLPNRGFLAALVALQRAAELIGEDAETTRIADFLTQSDPAAPAALAQGVPTGDLIIEEQE